jgi:low temperature requirement protein LtrA
MTALTAPVPAGNTSQTVGHVRSLLLVDGLGTALLGVGALAAASPLSDHVGSPAALRVVGVLFLVLGADMLLTRRLSGRRLTAAVTGLAALDLVWAAGTTAALPLLSTTATGTTLVLGVAAVCVGMGSAKLLLARQLRG